MDNRRNRTIWYAREPRKKKEEVQATEKIEKETREQRQKREIDVKINIKERYRKDIETGASEKIKLVAYTSISPSHKNLGNQQVALDSWHKQGLEIYSLNSQKEIEALKKDYPDWINFIPAAKTVKHIFGKPCVLINEMMDHFYENRTGDVLMLINSDIILTEDREILDKIKSISQVCVPISHRSDYIDEISKNRKYEYGFDVFFIHRKFIPLFPPALYSMGETWWDYWIPYTVLKNNESVFLIEELIAFHKTHANQYKMEDWVKMTEYFKWENNMKGDSQEINDKVRNQIKAAAISFNL